jgi:hypothetical protein
MTRRTLIRLSLGVIGAIAGVAGVFHWVPISVSQFPDALSQFPEGWMTYVAAVSSCAVVVPSIAALAGAGWARTASIAVLFPSLIFWTFAWLLLGFDYIFGIEFGPRGEPLAIAGAWFALGVLALQRRGSGER